jgi:metal-sulfur cluster biosynthetic enzyme
MTLTADEAFEALRAVPEPCSIAMAQPTDIVSMGLVESVRVEERAVAVSLVLTDPSCVHFAALRAYVGDVLLQRDDVDSVEVTMSVSQLWTPDRMNPTGPPRQPTPTLLPVVAASRASP